MREVPESEVRRLVRDAVDRLLGPEAATEPASETREEGRSTRRPAPESKRVAIGADHGGYALKQLLVRSIRDELGWEVHDCGTHGPDPVDYPDFAAAVARDVASGHCSRGIVVDAAGIGSSIAANKIAGVRCALCHDDATALNSRLHNDANVLALGARVVNRGLALRLARLFLETPFEGGRHARRVLKIAALESTRSPA